MAENTQHKLDKVRPPRVQITYDVEIGNATETKELPFVMGVLADLSGAPKEPLPKLKDRKFVEVDRDNLNEIMASIKPRLAVSVSNKIAHKGQLKAELVFKSMDDFGPLSLVKQIPVLEKLYEARSHLKDLLAKLDGNDVLEEMLSELMSNKENLEYIQRELSAAKKPDEELQEPAKKELKSAPVASSLRVAEKKTAPISKSNSEESREAQLQAVAQIVDDLRSNDAPAQSAIPEEMSREQLKGLLTKLDENEVVDELLHEIIEDKDKRKISNVDKAPEIINVPAPVKSSGMPPKKPAK